MVDFDEEEEGLKAIFNNFIKKDDIKDILTLIRQFSSFVKGVSDPQNNFF